MSSFSDRFNALYKKRKKQENENNKTESNNTQKSVSLGHGLYSSTDIAPVAEDPNVISSKYTPTTVSGTGFDANKNKNDFKKDTINAVGGASVIATTPKVENRTWFNDGAFDDGYQFGDVSKTILGTAGNVLESAGEGVVDMGESTVDGLAMLGAMLNEGQMMQAAQDEMIYNFVTGKEDDGVLQRYQNYQDQVEKSTSEFVAKDLYDSKAVVDTIIGKPLEFVGIDTDDSILGEKSQDLVKSGGQLAATAGLQALGVPWYLTTGLTSFGSSSEEALQNGASFNEATFSAAISASAEILTEQISGGIKFGGKTLDDALTKTLARTFADKTTRTLAKLGVDMAGEGLEEVLSGIMDAIGKKLTYEDEEKLFGKDGIFSTEEAFESFIGGMVLGGGSSVISSIKTNKDGVDAVTGLKTDTEQKIVDKLFEDAIKESTANGEKLTDKDKRKIYDNILNDLENGYISTDVIEEVLGENSAEYKAYMDEVNKRDATTKEYEALGNKTNPTLAEQSRYSILEKTVDFYKSNPLDGLKSKASESVYNSIKDTKLAESYNEQARRAQKYEADLAQYDEKRAAIIQKAIDSGVLNNTRRTHEFVDMVAKISADKGVSFDFTNNTKLKESGFALDGKTVNGFVTKDGVTLNMNAKKSLNTVVGHEITHVLEETELYEKLSDAVIEYAKSKGEYDSRHRDIWNLYKSNKDFKAEDIDKELVADLVGDYLFTDKDFVNSLSTNNRNVFQKIYDEIKYLCKVAVGTKEARELEKVKKAFERAYRADSKAVEGTQYSLGYHAGDLGKAESYGEQGYYRGTGHFGTGTYFVGDEAKISDSHYGKRPHHSVEFDNYNLYKIRNDNDGTKLHKSLKAIDGGITQEIVDAAKEDKFQVSELRHEANERIDKYDVKEYDADLGFEVSSNYTDASIQAYTEVANENEIEIQSYDEWLAEQSDEVPKPGDPDYEYYKTDYVEYLRDSIEEFDNERNNGYEPFRDAYFDLWLRFGKERVNNALQAVIEYEAKMEQSDYKTQMRSDSRATVFMKALGYEGIDTRGTGLDNTEYGSVIYDLKGDDLAKKNAIGTAKFSLSEYTAEEKKAHNKAVVDHFGKTYSWNETGYLLLDGTRLDMSGKHDGAPGGYRTVDHRDITEALGYDYGSGDYSGSLVQFMSEGNIRIIPECNGINLSVKPTKAQEEALSNYISRNRGEVMLDIDDLNGNTVVSVEYPYGTYYTKVLNDIREWFDNGKKPENAGSYSLTKDGDTPKQYGNWNVRGEDIAYSPTQEDISKTETPTEEVAPIAEEISGTSSEMEQVAPNTPAASLADLAKQSRREELRGAYNDAKSGKQYITDGSFIAEFYTIDESIEQSENFPAKRVQEAIDTAFRRDTDVDYAIDTANITEGYIKVGNSIFDVKYVNAVVGAMENPEFSLSHVPGGVDALLVYGDNGNAVLMPVRAGDNVNIVYEAQKVDNAVDEVVDEGEAPSMQEIFGDEYGPTENAYTIEQEIESVQAEMKAVFEEYNQLKAEGKDAEAQPLFEKFLDLTERGQELSKKAEAYKAEDKSAFESLTDADAPAEVEAPYSEDGGIIDPFEERDVKAVGDRAVKAYMYENPEVKPFFQEEANILLGELENAHKGERYYTETPDGNPNAQYGAESYGFWTGTKRNVTPDIEKLLDDGKGNGTGYTYDEIRKGLEAIIEDNGKENNACSKRIEFILNDRLMNGYVTDGGYPIDANQEYRNLIKEKGITEYNDEAFKRLIDDYDATHPKAPEPIAPIAPEPIAPETFDTADKKQVPGQQTLFESEKTETAPIEDIAPIAETVTESTEEPKIAEVLESAPKEQKKIKLGKKIKNLLVDKQSAIEDVSLKAKNRELMAKADFMLRSESRAQRHIKNKLLPILEKIEKTGNRKAYETYAYHLHNIDRMSLESNIQPRLDELKGKFEGLKTEQIKAIAAKKITDKTTEKTANTIREAKEYLDLLEVKNKPVFGDEVTADKSREFVKAFEAEHADAREIADTLTAYNTELRQMLVDGGVISQETADLWAEMYPHYVPIKRAGKDGAAIKVPLDSMRTGVNAPIAKATGGNSDMESLLDVMGARTEQVYRAIARNSFGVELMNTLDTVVDSKPTNIDEVLDSFDNHYDELLKKGENGANPTFTVFVDGKRVTFDITEELYDALKPTNEALKAEIPVLSHLTKIQRGILTQYNPTFIVTNLFKDIGDVISNSQHPGRTYANIPAAVKELVKGNGKWITEYMENGGEDLTYFDSRKQVFKKDSTVKKVLGFVPDKIAKANDFIEKLPRLAEYIASRKKGASIEVAMLDAARVTTNFAAGGDLGKAINRNGVTFFNASIQGFNQQVRNVREAKANGAKGVMQLAAKFAIAGLPIMLLNHLLWDDDEEYAELSDYVKDNYYIVAKYGDGKFVRIPKGRAVAVIQNAFEQMKNLVTGNDEVDMGRFGELLLTNLAPNDPITNNVIAPVMQVANNKTWYGEELVPTRLQGLPEAEQYDETTDSISKWLAATPIGEKLNWSPYKINYLLDQYSGGIGDTFLPMLTPESDGSGVIAPFIDKFTTDSVMKNQNVSDFYTTVDELTKAGNSMYATEDDILSSKYINSVNADLGELYKQKREIQNNIVPEGEQYDDIRKLYKDKKIPDKVKDELVREIQKQIDEIAKSALDTYSDIDYQTERDGKYAIIGDKYFKYNDEKDIWTKLDDEQVIKYKVTSAAGDASYASDGENHFRWYVPSEDAGEDAKEGWRKITDDELERQNEVTKGLDITPEEYWSNKEEYCYAYDYPGNYAVSKAVGGYEAYRTYSSELFDIKADKDEYGKSISGSRKEKVLDYINNLDADYYEKIILFKSEYNADDTYNYEIIDYLNSREDLSYKDIETILKELGFTVDSKGNIYWD